MTQNPERFDPEEPEIQRLVEEQEFFNSQEYWDQVAVERERRKEVTFTVNGRLAEITDRMDTAHGARPRAGTRPSEKARTKQARSYRQ